MGGRLFDGRREVRDEGEIGDEAGELGRVEWAAAGIDESADT